MSAAKTRFCMLPCWPRIPEVSARSGSARGLGLWGGEKWGLRFEQLYRGFDIGTAKPRASARAAMKNQWTDCARGPTISATGVDTANWRMSVWKTSQRKNAIFTAPHGFVLRAMLEGRAEVPTTLGRIARRALRGESWMEYIRRPLCHLPRVLKRYDPRQTPRDRAPIDNRQKSSRAIEVACGHGRRSQELHREAASASKGRESDESD